MLTHSRRVSEEGGGVHWSREWDHAGHWGGGGAIIPGTHVAFLDLCTHPQQLEECGDFAVVRGERREWGSVSDEGWRLGDGELYFEGCRSSTA